MGVIKPTLTLTSNASSATTDAGPLSIALSLSASGTFDVDSKMPTRTGFKYIDNIGNVSNQTNDQQPAE